MQLGGEIFLGCVSSGLGVYKLGSSMCVGQVRRKRVILVLGCRALSLLWARHERWLCPPWHLSLKALGECCPCPWHSKSACLTAGTGLHHSIHVPTTSLSCIDSDTEYYSECCAG